MDSIRKDVKTMKEACAHPNVLLVVTDQQRFDTLGCYGNPYVDTPNLDKLAAEGVLFENAYCQSPVCTPSRASFLTGRYPRTTRCRANGQSIPADERLISRVLAGHGYYCALAGKLHLAPCGPTACHIREQRVDDGFTDFHWAHNPSGIGNAGLPESGGAYWSGNEYSRWLFRRGKTYHCPNYDPAGYVQTGMDEEDHFTKWCIDQAIDWIRYSAEEKRQMPQFASPPWFYNINLFDPHHAFDPPKRLLDKYLARSGQLPLPKYLQGEWSEKTLFQQLDHAHAYNNVRAPHHFCFDEMCDEEHRMIKAAYYAMVEMIDIQFGRLMDTLAETGEIDNTIIIFTADHGEMLGDHGIYLKGPYFYEGLVHVPMIMSWKGRFMEGVRLEAMVELTDIVPTIEELCLGNVEPGVQGRSLAGILTGKQDPAGHRSSIYCEYYQAMPWHTEPEAHGTMVYDGQYKLARFHTTGEGELYDLKADPDELHNLWNDPACIQVKVRMLELLSDRMADTVDPLPLPADKW